MSDFEFRPFAEPVEVRSTEGGRLVLSGTAIRYGARSKDLGGFRERIMPGAATELMQKGEVLAMEEQRSERYLGRTGNGTLRLIDSPTELRYEVDLPDTAVGREVAALAQRGDYRGSSFGFKPQSAKWTTTPEGPLRTITSFKVFRDVGPTVTPAYDTGVAEAALRNLPVEAELDIEVRSVLDAAKSGHLAALLDGETSPPTEAEPVIEETPAEEPLVIHRRPAHWFI